MSPAITWVALYTDVTYICSVYAFGSQKMLSHFIGSQKCTIFDKLCWFGQFSKVFVVGVPQPINCIYVFRRVDQKNRTNCKLWFIYHLSPLWMFKKRHTWSEIREKRGMFEIINRFPIFSCLFIYLIWHKISITRVTPSTHSVTRLSYIVETHCWKPCKKSQLSPDFCFSSISLPDQKLACWHGAVLFSNENPQQFRRGRYYWQDRPHTI